MHGISYKSFFICLSGFRDHKKTHDTASAQAIFRVNSIFKVYLQNTANQSGLLSIYITLEIYIFRLQKKKKERKEIEKKMLVGRSSNVRIPYSALIVLKELF